MNRRKAAIWLIALGGVLEALFLLYRFLPTPGFRQVETYQLVFIIVFGLVVAGALRLNRLSDEPNLVIIIGFSLLFAVTLIPADPALSDDVYRYVWDGKVVCSGLNPFRYAPDDPDLDDLHSEVLPARINFPHIKTIYPPFAQTIFASSYLLFAENVNGFKWILIVFLMASQILFNAIRKHFGLPPGLLLIFAWHPLVIMETAVNAHLDIVMLACVLAWAWMLIRKRFALSALALAAAVLVKLLPVILVPVGLREVVRRSGRKAALRWILVFSGIAVAAYVPFMPAAVNMFRTALNYSSHWYFNHPVFLGVLALAGDNPTAHLVMFILFAVLFLLVLRSRMVWRRRVVVIWLLVIVCNPTIHPWYLITLVGLLCLYCDTRIILWSGTVVFSYAAVRSFLLTGVWRESWVAMAAEYLPLLLLVILPKVHRVLEKRFCAVPIASAAGADDPPVVSQRS